MAQFDPLDFPVLSSLRGRHAAFAMQANGAVRYQPAYAVFAAVADRSETSLAGLAALAEPGDVALIERDPPVDGPGLTLSSENLGVQMLAGRLIKAPPPCAGLAPLGERDAPEMLALAELTAPGPFFARTHCLGDFFGVRREGRLVAMAGERMKPDGFTEVSGVCTHPDFRGQGLAAMLTQLVAARIFARGETPFLHTYARNTEAIALYQRLGFAIRREVLMVRLTLAPAPPASAGPLLTGN